MGAPEARDGWISDAIRLVQIFSRFVLAGSAAVVQPGVGFATLGDAIMRCVCNPMRGLAQAKEPEHRQNDDDQTNDIDDSIHCDPLGPMSTPRPRKGPASDSVV
jgi:hypothetical protein